MPCHFKSTTSGIGGRGVLLLLFMVPWCSRYKYNEIEGQLIGTHKHLLIIGQGWSGFGVHPRNKVWVQGGVKPAQDASASQGLITNFAEPACRHILGKWKATGKPRWNPHRCRKNVWNIDSYLSSGSNQEPWSSEMGTLPTSPQCLKKRTLRAKEKEL